MMLIMSRQPGKLTWSAARLCAVAFVLLPLAACQESTGPVLQDRTVPADCGLDDLDAVTGLLGPHVDTSLDGSPDRLRDHGEPLRCTLTARGQPDRFVRITALHHPAPMKLPRWACNAGRVYAGTPADHAPACQQEVGTGGRTVLLTRSGEYVIRVAIRRSDQNWGGDAEAALELSRQFAARLESP